MFIFSLQYNSINVYNKLVVSWALLFFKSILGYDQVLGAVAPLGYGGAVGLLAFTNHEFDRIVLGIACEKSYSFISGPDGPILPVDITFVLYQLIGVNEECVL